MMGKLWFHAEEKQGGGRRFERIVVDCPSTGHAVKLLGVSKVLTDVVRVGPMRDKTKQMTATFADRKRSAIHVVTLPEELPVNETIELLGVLPRAFDERTEAALRRVDVRDDAALADVVAAAKRRAGRERLESRELARLLEAGRPLIEIPLLPDNPLTLKHVDRVGELLRELP